MKGKVSYLLEVDKGFNLSEYILRLHYDNCDLDF